MKLFNLENGLYCDQSDLYISINRFDTVDQYEYFKGLTVLAYMYILCHCVNDRSTDPGPGGCPTMLLTGMKTIIILLTTSWCNTYGKPFYYLLCKKYILYVISDIL